MRVVGCVSRIHNLFLDNSESPFTSFTTLAAQQVAAQLLIFLSYFVLILRFDELLISTLFLQTSKHSKLPSKMLLSADLRYLIIAIS